MGKWIINLSPPAICKALRTQTHVRTQIGIVLSCLCRKSLTDERKTAKHRITYIQVYEMDFRKAGHLFIRRLT